MNTHVVSDLAWVRMVTSVEKVRERLRRAVAALEQSCAVPGSSGADEVDIPST